MDWLALFDAAKVSSVESHDFALRSATTAALDVRWTGTMSVMFDATFFTASATDSPGPRSMGPHEVAGPTGSVDLDAEFVEYCVNE
jgi:hypothetical protein